MASPKLKKAAKLQKEKVTDMNPNVTAEQKVPEVTRSVENPFTGEDITRKATYNLPIATDFNHALEISGRKEDEIVFWFNHGRKLAARSQVFQMLDFQWASNKLKDDYKAFKNAMESLLPKNADADRRKLVKEFVLSQPKFDELKNEMATMETEGIDTIHVDFDTTELKKPTGIRGAKKKKVEGEADSAEDETEETEETEVPA